MNTRFLGVLMLCILAGCSSSKYRIVEPRPTLALSETTASCELGKTINLTLTVDQEDAEGNLSLSVFIRQGQAQVSLDGEEIDTNGKWVQLAGKSAKMAIMPTTLSDLTIILQAKSPNGETSDQQELNVTVTTQAEISAKAICEAKIVNLEAGGKIPVQLLISGEGSNEKYVVTPTINQGKGKIYLDGNVVNGANCPVNEYTKFEYAPDVIGEQILEFTVSTDQVTTKARAYMDIVKNITVTSAVEGCFTIDGAGEHNIEGKTISLTLVNEELFNFEVAGWYDMSGRLLSNDEKYAITLWANSITDLEVRHKPRTVTITQQGIAQIEFKYLLMENGRPVPKSAYDYRTQFSADFKASEPIKFYYEEYRLDKGKVPPPGVKSNAAPLIPKGATRSSFLWRCDKKFSVYLRSEDNPDFEFNNINRYIQSRTTKYIIPQNIIMLN